MVWDTVLELEEVGVVCRVFVRSLGIYKDRMHLDKHRIHKRSLCNTCREHKRNSLGSQCSVQVSIPLEDTVAAVEVDNDILGRFGYNAGNSKDRDCTYHRGYNIDLAVVDNVAAVDMVAVDRNEVEEGKVAGDCWVEEAGKPVRKDTMALL